MNTLTINLGDVLVTKPGRAGGRRFIRVVGVYNQTADVHDSDGAGFHIGNGRGRTLQLSTLASRYLLHHRSAAA